VRKAPSNGDLAGLHVERSPATPVGPTGAGSGLWVFRTPGDELETGRRVGEFGSTTNCPAPSAAYFA
jgi:hypothetical protein